MKFVFIVLLALGVLAELYLADINVKNSMGESALSSAIMRGRTDMAVYLINKGADVNISDINGITPLIIASAKGDISILNMLISKGAKVNSSSNGGVTALMYAAGEGRTEIENILISKGADKDAKDKNGRSVTEYRNLYKSRPKTDYIERKTWNESWESINDKYISAKERERRQINEENKRAYEEKKEAESESRWSTTKGAKR